MIRAGLIALYEELSEKTEAMLMAANEGEWQQVTDLEAERQTVLTRIKAYPILNPEPDEARQLAGTLQEILDRQSQLYARTAAEFDRCRKLIVSTSQERKITQAYTAR
ncbi:MAG: flagellar protein FliT [Gammaproteobacteria bacterium]|nr:flagellar protein FliT [Gammaproteobacteria bacterium]